MYKKIIIKKDTEICVIIDQAIHIIFLSKQIKGEFFFTAISVLSAVTKFTAIPSCAYEEFKLN